MSLNPTYVQKIHEEAQALQFASLQERIPFVIRLTASIKSAKDEQSKKAVLECLRGYANPLFDASAVDHSILVINKVWTPSPSARSTMINRPFEEIASKLKGITLTDEEKQKGIDYLFHSIRDLNNKLNG